MTNAAAQLESEVRVEAGRTTILEIKTEGQALAGESGSLEISVTEENGEVAPSRMIYMYNMDERLVQEKKTDVGGKVRFDGIVPGTYMLSLELISAPEVVTPDPSVALTGSYAINLKDTEDVPVPKGPVYLISVNWEKIYPIAIDGAGHGEQRDIAPGKYTLALEKKVKLEGKIKFKVNEHSINKAGATILDEIIQFIQSRNTENIRKIFCVGYASNDGSSVRNDNLCILRGATVRDNLKEKFKHQKSLNGIGVESTIGGVLPGSSDEEREKNRRTEIEILFN